MSCPKCNCKEVYQYDEEDAPDDDWQRCAACGLIFHLDDHAPEKDDMEEPAGIPASPKAGESHD